MKLFGSMTNNDGELEIGGIKATDLAQKYKTPLYVMDESLIRDNINIFKDNFRSDKFDTEVVYASKAFLNVYMAKLIKEMGLSLDVVSAGELFIAKTANFPMERVFFHGNNKSDEELKLAIDNKVGTVILDNISEARRLNDFIKDDYVQNVQLRLNPGVEAETHEYIKTTKNDSKFGESIYDEKVINEIQEISNMKNLCLKGFHYHIGSQIFKGESFVIALDTMIEFIKKIEKLGINISVLNMGGGFGVYYTKGDHPIDFEKYFKKLINYIETKMESENVRIEKFIIEPGRSIVGNAGTTLYTVGGVKNTYAGRKYILIDGGMTDNIRPALYKAEYEAVIANDMNKEYSGTYTVAGKCCESGDIIIRDKLLQKPNRGDILAVSTTGAYCYMMSSNYNMLLKPAIVFVKDGKDILTNRRQRFEDLILTDL